MHGKLLTSLVTLALVLTGSAASAADGNYYFLTNGVTGGQADVSFNYGKSQDAVLVGDWDGDGDDTLAVRRGKRYYLSNELTGGTADLVFDYGRDGDEVFVGDWDGDGDDTLAVRRGRTFFVNFGLTGGAADKAFVYGRDGDTVIVGDWDGDGDDTFGVRRGNQYFLNNTLEGGPADIAFGYGRAGDRVFTGDWDGDGDETLAVRRGKTFYLNNALEGGVADVTYAYGRADDIVLVGDWDNDDRDTPGLRREGFRFSGSGQYVVGTDVPHGLYRAAVPDTACYWERQAGFSGSFDEIIANGFRSGGNWIVQIAASDAGFATVECGTWQEIHLTDVGVGSTRFGDGMYRVGIDIRPGTYKGVVGPDGCYWERLSDFSGDGGGIISNSFRADPGSNVFVTIQSTDAGFDASGCGTWQRQ